MRYLVLSDLHSNLEALRAVLAAAEGMYDQVVCCGDLVGYGADPNPVVEWVREHVTAVVRGNHDKACSGLTQPDDFSEAAQTAAYWTREHLTPENREYLKMLPRGPQEIAEQFAIVHGSPRDEDEYIPAPWAAVEVFDSLPHRITFFGHTHLQGGFVRGRRRITEITLKPISRRGISAIKARGLLEIGAGEVYFLNPGSIGQPRDRDNRAAFAIFDSDGFVEYGRADYDVETAMQKIIQAGLPEFLAYRLAVGR